jgi:fructosamine-3-kinase
MAGDGFFGPLDQPLPLISGRYEGWGEFYADCRMSQVRDLLAARGRLSARLASDLDRTIAALRDGAWGDEPPARVHGDLWSGNVVWTSGGVALIDPAAHGGHRMTDLAMLELFGLPYLADVRAGYGAVHPLPQPWRDVVGLHQLYPLGMHAVLFGGGYLPQFARLVAENVARHA